MQQNTSRLCKKSLNIRSTNSFRQMFWSRDVTFTSRVYNNNTRNVVLKVCVRFCLTLAFYMLFIS